MNKEIWKDIVGYEGLYQVSNFGNIKNKRKIRKLQLRKDGYLHIPLSKNGKAKRKINQYDKQYNFIKQWNSIKEASVELNIKEPHITRVCKGGRKTTGNYIFKYVKEK